MSPNGPDPVDIHVGNRIRLRRKEIGQSQSALAEQYGVSWQQLQKVEKGANRVSASALFKIATAQGVTPAYYFEGLDASANTQAAPEASAAAVWMRTKAAWPIAQAMIRLPAHMQRAVVSVAESLAAAA